MEMKITNIEYQKIRRELFRLRLRCQPSSNWATIFNNLVSFAERNEIKVLKVRYLVSNRGALGAYFPLLKTISIQESGSIKEQTTVLSHEIAHLIFHKAGVFRKYDYEEGLADTFGSTIVSLLST
jgi:Zn-dependent peptidase ImmA (M78 family)